MTDVREPAVVVASDPAAIAAAAERQPRPLPGVAMANWEALHPHFFAPVCGRCSRSLSEMCITNCSPEGQFRWFSLRRDAHQTIGQLRELLEDDDMFNPKMSIWQRLALLCLHHQVDLEWRRSQR